MDGGTYLGTGVADIVRRIMSQPNQDDAIEGLTDREREVLLLIAEGASSKEIAAKLSISIKTVETHRTNLMEKTNRHGIAELTRYAIENKVIKAAPTPDTGH